jgi:hypothetical protein
VTNLALKGLAYRTGTGRRWRIGRFVAADVLIAGGLVSVTEHSRFEPSTRSDLGHAGELTMSARKRMVMFEVTLAGNGTTTSVMLNAAAANALQLAIWGHHTEASTSEQASLVAQAVERFTRLLGNPAQTVQGRQLDTSAPARRAAELESHIGQLPANDLRPRRTSRAPVTHTRDRVS